jgi:hypothetical protein
MRNLLPGFSVYRKRAHVLMISALLPAVSLTPRLSAQSSFLPLSEGAKWVLRNPNHKEPVVFEIARKQGNEFYFVSKYPWGTSEWALEPKGDAYIMTRLGTGGQTMPLNDRPVFVDFSRSARSKWSNSLGTLEIESTSTTVRGAANTYSNGILLRHRPKNGSQVFVFAPGVGFVQYAEGRNAFVLDEAASRLPGESARAAPPAPLSSGEPIRRERVSPRGGRSNSEAPARVPIGLTFNSFANEPKTPQNILKRFEQTLDAGVDLLVGGASWRELEPENGRYNLGDITYLASVSESKQMPVAYSLKIIETVHKAVPADLANRSWNSPEMRARVLKLIDEIVPILKTGQLRWFNFGYEIEGYLSKHPREVADFVELYKTAASRIKQIVSGVQVGSTIAYMDLDSLNGRLSALNGEMDYIAVTYSPINPGWTVKEPVALHDDFARLKAVAAGRKILLQEIAYPTSSLNDGSQEKQAEFFRRAFEEVERDPGSFVAANFMMLGDLSDADTENFGRFYGLPGDKKFKAMMQTLGMFDTNGQPKLSWEVFRQHTRR